MPDTNTTTALMPKIIRPEQGASINAFGIPMTIMLRAEDTGGAFASLVAEFVPDQGPPPHFHHDHEEYFFVLEGDFELTVGGNTAIAGPGSMVFVPRETVHSFKYVGTTKGRIFEWGIPGGQERYFEAIDKLGASGELNPETIVRTSLAHETEFVA